MKKTILLITVCSLLLLMFSLSVTATDYDDINGHWAKEQIEKWSDAGILKGSEGLFRPNDSITRGEMAVIIDRLMVYQAASGNNFSDLSANAWYTPALLRLNEANVILGAYGKIRPNDSVTRQEAAAMLVRAFAVKPLNGGEMTAYADYDKIAPWASENVQIMSQNNYMQGANNLFRPQDKITRAEIVKIIDNIIAFNCNNSNLYSFVVDGSVRCNSQGMNIINSYIDGNLYITGNATGSVMIENTVITGEIINIGQASLLWDAQGGRADKIYYANNGYPIALNLKKNTRLATDFTLVDGRMTYKGGEYRCGIDVSSWQENIDWRAVAADGIDFAMLRVGYRGYVSGATMPDTYFTQNLQGATANGLDVGVYYYSQATGVEEAIEEANIVLDAIKGYDITYPIVYDWENVSGSTARTDKMPAAVTTDCALAFCETIQAAGYTPMVYFNIPIGLRHYDLSRLGAYDFWFAGYTTAPRFYYDLAMWQYSSTGRVKGIKGNVDLDISFVDYSDKQ
ncbi:MAG: GH25 family lysozyme [Clostridia bacterium]|nr:GH25 family lysozyme [Clostridia bacterium]